MAQLIEEITASARQTMKVELEDGTTFELDLEYRLQQQGWFYNIRYEDFILNGFRLALNINLLSQFDNLIPFGFMVSSDDGIDPTNINDFEVSRVNLSVLNEEEVAQVNTFLNSQKETAGEI